jgi:hypothetical protein
MIFETASSDEHIPEAYDVVEDVNFAVDIQDDDLDRNWSRYGTYVTEQEARKVAKGLFRLPTVLQAMVVKVPGVRFERVCG